MGKSKQVFEAGISQKLRNLRLKYVPLPFPAETHLCRVLSDISGQRSVTVAKMLLLGYLRHEGVEKGIELLCQGSFLCPEDSSQPLGLLASGASMGRDLDQDVRLGKVEAGVGHLGDKDGVDLSVVFEVLQDLNPLRLTCGAVNVRSVELRSVMLKSVDIV